MSDGRTMLESEYATLLAGVLRRGDAVVKKIHGHAMQSPGLPDLYVAHPLYAGWIELKRDDGECSPEQRETMNAFMGAGVPALVCRIWAGNHERIELCDGTELLRGWRGDCATRLGVLARVVECLRSGEPL